MHHEGESGGGGGGGEGSLGSDNARELPGLFLGHLHGHWGSWGLVGVLLEGSDLACLDGPEHSLNGLAGSTAAERWGSLGVTLLTCLAVTIGSWLLASGTGGTGAWRLSGGFVGGHKLLDVSKGLCLRLLGLVPLGPEGGVLVDFALCDGVGPYFVELLVLDHLLVDLALLRSDGGDSSGECLLLEEGSLSSIKDSLALSGVIGNCLLGIDSCL